MACSMRGLSAWPEQVTVLWRSNAVKNECALEAMADKSVATESRLHGNFLTRHAVYKNAID